jgi:hypothetical protein
MLKINTPPNHRLQSLANQLILNQTEPAQYSPSFQKVANIMKRFKSPEAIVDTLTTAIRYTAELYPNLGHLFLSQIMTIMVGQH